LSELAIHLQAGAMDPIHTRLAQLIQPLETSQVMSLCQRPGSLTLNQFHTLPVVEQVLLQPHQQQFYTPRPSQPLQILLLELAIRLWVGVMEQIDTPLVSHIHRLEPSLAM
jgi:hypothetical protein